eukprot:Skav210584  [mRNA]  locus=scaffold3272:110487:112020:+ [translate_table: standard]
MANDDGSCKTGLAGAAIGAQFILVIMVILWSGILSLIIFALLKLTGTLRISEEVESVGMDTHHHSPAKAYSLEASAPVGSKQVAPVVPSQPGAPVSAWSGGAAAPL